jgi:hypothetical protein
VPRFESVHLSHFEGPTANVPPRIAKQLAFYGDLARFASCTESGRARRTPIRCRRRPGHKQCRGLIVVRRRNVPARIEWECPGCSAGGAISGWEETGADLRHLDLDPDKAARAVAVSVPEHAALREAARVDASLVPLAWGAQVDEAGQPHLLVTPRESLRYGRVLLRHAWEASPRYGGLLIALAEALANVADPGAAFMELDAATGEALAGALLRLPDVRQPEFIPMRPRSRPRSTERCNAQPKTFQIKVTLRDVKPAIWRRLIVPSDILLPALHEVLQAAVGWSNCHLHLFRVRNRVFAPPCDEFEPIGQDSHDVSLAQIAPRKGSRVVYEYDFGDGWSHDIIVEDVVDGRCPSVRCLKGRRRCPPEDCGGPWGYAELCEALADPTHERHDELREWFPDGFDPEAFDVVETDAIVRAIPVRGR